MTPTPERGAASLDAEYCVGATAAEWFGGIVSPGTSPVTSMVPSSVIYLNFL
jgi:hypothetical protein